MSQGHLPPHRDGPAQRYDARLPTVVCTAEMYAAVQRAALTADVTVATVVRAALRHWLRSGRPGLPRPRALNMPDEDHAASATGTTEFAWGVDVTAPSSTWAWTDESHNVTAKTDLSDD